MENENKTEESKVVEVKVDENNNNLKKNISCKKKHGPLYWVIIIAGMTFIVSASINLGEMIGKTVSPDVNNITPNSNEESNLQIKENEPEMTSDDATLYIDGYKDILQFIKKEGLSDNIKLYKSIFVDLESLSVESDAQYTCDTAFDDSANSQKMEGIYTCVDGENKVYSYEKVNKAYKENYGVIANAPTVAYNGYDYGTGYWDYSSKVNAYISLSEQFGGSCVTNATNYYEIESIKEEDEQILVDIIYLTYKPEIKEGTCGTGKEEFTYKYTINEQDNSVKKVDEINKVFEDNKASLPKLTFIFVKEDTKYILRTVK